MENGKDRRIQQLEQLVQDRTAQLAAALQRLEQSYDDPLEALCCNPHSNGPAPDGHR